MTPQPAFRCSSQSAVLGEAMEGTASAVADWLFIEQPGPWGSDALSHSRLPDGVGMGLRRASHRFGFRVILIRRTGAPSTMGGPPACFAVHAGPDDPWIARLPIETPSDLLHTDLGPLGSGEMPSGGERSDGRLLLVCTNGRRDPCCAERGRPLAGAVSEAVGDAAWECSHIGGDRFAGNLVCFPHGLYFGRLDDDTGPVVARAYVTGAIDLEHYRGRACFPFDVQAAEAWVRRSSGLRGVDDVRFVERRATGIDGSVVRFTGPGGRVLEARVVVDRTARPRQLTCHVHREASPPRYLVGPVGG